MNPNILRQFFREKFIAVDNLPVDCALQNRLSMEARAELLIEANATRELFPAFMKCGRPTDYGWVYQFKTPLTITTKLSKDSEEIHWEFTEFVIFNRKAPFNNSGKYSGRWSLDIRNLNAQPWSKERDKNWSDFLSSLSSDFQQKNLLPEHCIPEFEQAEEAFQKMSKYHICKDISPYSTPEQVCRFWRNEPTVFAPVKNARVHVDFLPKSEIRDEIDSPVFKNSSGEPLMQLLKFYDGSVRTITKRFQPQTSWISSNNPYNLPYGVPLPRKKQPLLHLDLLTQDECTTVILTDDVELAARNQEKCQNEHIVFTSFICSDDDYELVDWSPLTNKSVFYLLTNHSSIPMELATLKARELSDYLLANMTIDLSFIVLPVDYEKADNLLKTKDDPSAEEIENCYLPENVSIEWKKIRFIDSSTLDDLCKKAEDFIRQKSVEWWAENTDGEAKRIVETNSKYRARPPYILRPFLLRGEVSMLYASKSTGKSALALSMAAAIVAEKDLFEKHWWVATKSSEDSVSCQYPCRKVLYLDFENGQSEIGERRKEFVEPFLKNKEKDRQELCRQNLIIKDMNSVDRKDYSDDDNWNEVFGWLEEAKMQGVSGQPVDVLMIDTVSKFTTRPYSPSNSLSNLLGKLRQLNIAILMVHHEGSNQEVRGWKNLLDDVYFNVLLYRKHGDESQDNAETKTLQDDLTLEFKNSRSGIELNKPFQIRFDGRQWLDCDCKTEDEKRKYYLHEFKECVEQYRKKRLLDKDIFPILGIGKGTFNKLCKEAGCPKKKKF